jgi:hypothetical protein
MEEDGSLSPRPSASRQDQQPASVGKGAAGFCLDDQSEHDNGLPSSGTGALAASVGKSRADERRMDERNTLFVSRRRTTSSD